MGLSWLSLNWTGCDHQNRLHPQFNAEGFYLASGLFRLFVVLLLSQLFLQSALAEDSPDQKAPTQPVTQPKSSLERFSQANSVDLSMLGTMTGRAPRSALAEKQPSPQRSSSSSVAKPMSPFERFIRANGIDPSTLGATLGGESRTNFSNTQFAQIFCPIHMTFESVPKNTPLPDNESQDRISNMNYDPLGETNMK